MTSLSSLKFFCLKKLYYVFSSLSCGFLFNRIEILAVQEVGDENALNKVNTVSVYMFSFIVDSM